jgi:phosphatidylinositol 3-kinase
VTVLGRVEEKFRLDLTDEQAEHFFLSLVDESLRALAPMVLEKMHQFAVARR